MSVRGRKTLSDVRQWSGGVPRCSGVVGRPLEICERGQKALQDLREWSVGPHGFTGVVDRSSRIYGSC